MQESRENVCLAAFGYSKQLYNEYELYPLAVADGVEDETNRRTHTVRTALQCRFSGCEEPAYFYCNRGWCSPLINATHKYHHREAPGLFRGCGEAFCWKHFRFEFFLDRQQYNEPIGDDYCPRSMLEMAEARQIIINWHCTNSACSYKRRCTYCLCYTLSISPFLITIAAFLLSTFVWLDQEVK